MHHMSVLPVASAHCIWQARVPNYCRSALGLCEGPSLSRDPPNAHQPMPIRYTHYIHYGSCLCALEASRDLAPCSAVLPNQMSGAGSMVFRGLWASILLNTQPCGPGSLGCMTLGAELGQCAWDSISRGSNSGGRSSSILRSVRAPDALSNALLPRIVLCHMPCSQGAGCAPQLHIS